MHCRNLLFLPFLIPLKTIRFYTNYFYTSGSNFRAHYRVVDSLKDSVIGDTVSVISTGYKEVDVESSRMFSKVTKIESINDILKDYKLNKDTILGVLEKQSEFVQSNGSLGYRLVVRNLETGKLQAIFSNKGFDIQTEEFVQVDRQGWNDYSCRKIGDLKEKLLENKYLNGNITSGEIIAKGEQYIRNKPVYFIELKTLNGIIKKYGSEIETQVKQLNLQTGQCVSIVKERIRTMEKTSLKTFDVQILSEIANRRVIDRVEELKSLNSKHEDVNNRNKT